MSEEIEVEVYEGEQIDMELNNVYLIIDVIPDATPTSHGLMPAADKAKLNLILVPATEVDLSELVARTRVYWDKVTIDGVTQLVIVDDSEE